LNRKVLRPVAGSRVELVRSKDEKVLASGVTQQDGTYQLPLTLSEATLVYLRVLAQTDNARVVSVHGAVLFSIGSTAFPIEETSNLTKNLEAVDKNRGSGPFNILAAVAQANRLVRSVEPKLALPSVTIHWDTDYVEGTSFEGDLGAYINGKRDENSDEFDDTVIIHEYGHFLARNLSRDDTPGGPHWLGDRVDPRLAWSEGWATFFACASVNDPFFVDTLKPGDNFAFSLDQPDSVTDNPGYWSEYTVASSLWNIFAPRHKGTSHLGIGFSPIWEVFRGPLRTDRFASLVTFSDHLVQVVPKGADELATYLRTRNVKYTPFKTPSVPNRYPIPLASGSVMEGKVDSWSTKRINLLDSSRFYVFRLAKPSKVSIHLDIVAADHPEAADLDLYLWHRPRIQAKPIASSTKPNGVKGTEDIQIELQPGEYIVEVRSWRDRFNAGSYRLKATY
jgi:hypothetical protein